jgi:MFS family permease
MLLRRLRIVFNTIVFLSWLATGLPMAVMILLLQARGLSLIEIGVCLTVLSLSVTVLELPTGAFADSLGRRRSILLSYACKIIGLLIYLISFSLPWFLLGSCILGLGRALASGALEAWFVDASRAAAEDADLQAGFAQSGVAQVAGTGLGLLLGGLLPRALPGLPPDGKAVLSPLGAVLVAATAVWVLVAVLSVRWIREPAGQPGSPVRARRGMWSVARHTLADFSADRSLLLLFLPYTFWGLAFASIETFWQPFFSDLAGGFQGRTHWFGATFALGFAFAGLGSFLAIPITRLLARRYALVCALASALQLVAIVLLAVQTRFLAAALFLWLLYSGNGLLQSPQAALLNERIPAERRATLLSVSSLFFTLGGALGNLALGYIANTYSIRSAWLTAAGPLAAALAIYLTLARSPAAATSMLEPAAPELR